MKRILFLLMVVISTTVIAQQGELSADQKKEAKAKIEAYLKRLNLSEDQKPKVKEIVKRYRAQMTEVKKSDDSRFKKMGKLKELNQKKNEEMKVLLNDEQYKVYEEIQAEKRAQAKARRKR